MSDANITPGAGVDPENPEVPDTTAHADFDHEAVVDELDVDPELVIDEFDDEQPPLNDFEQELAGDDEE